MVVEKPKPEVKQTTWRAEKVEESKKVEHPVKKKQEIKVGGKTKIEINPEADIGNFSGGMRTNSGNLH